MPAEYPFIPKSNAKMRFGDYWPLRREDGDFGFCVFLEPWAHLRKGIVIGVLDIVSERPLLDPDGPVIALVEAANTRVETFNATSSSVVGNVADRVDRDAVDAFRGELKAVSRVWGLNVPLTRVNLVANRRRV
jgi:hypothetical protein